MRNAQHSCVTPSVCDIRMLVCVCVILFRFKAEEGAM